MRETSETSEQTLQTPFNMMIVGMTGCGKTHYLLSMLEEEYFGHFEYIFLICPTYNWNKTYQERVHKPGDLKTRKRTGTSCQIEIHFFD